MRKKILLFALPLLLLSCASTQKPGENEGVAPEPEWKRAASLDDLYGIWEGEEYSYEYPFELDGHRYMRKFYAEKDDTQKWQDFAKRNGLSLSELWKKRFAYIEKIYGEKLPLSDSAGSECGIKLRLIGSRIYARREYLVPERILGFNMGFFLLSGQKDRLKEMGTFHFASPVFSDFSASRDESGEDSFFERRFSESETYRRTSL